MIWTLIRKFAPYLIAAAVFAAVLFASYRHGVTTERAVQQLVIKQMELEAQTLRTAYATETTRLSEEVRAGEQAKAARIATIDQQHQEAIAYANTELDKLRADVRAGAIRLRPHFTCTDTTNATGKAATSTGVSHGGTQGGLRTADEEFLIRIAREADDITRQLHACQAIVRSDRE